jgi:hypothetical protein
MRVKSSRGGAVAKKGPASEVSLLTALKSFGDGNNLSSPHYILIFVTLVCREEL